MEQEQLLIVDGHSAIFGMEDLRALHHGPKRHLAHFTRSRQAGEQYLRCACNFRRRSANPCATRFERLDDLRAQVQYRHRVVMVGQTHGDRAAHVAQPDETDVHSGRTLIALQVLRRLVPD